MGKSKGNQRNGFVKEIEDYRRYFLFPLILVTAHKRRLGTESVLRKKIPRIA